MSIALRRAPTDGYGREINYLRLSLTDHCNLRCVYCMPLEGLAYAPPDELLTATELELVVRAAAAASACHTSTACSPLSCTLRR